MPRQRPTSVDHAGRAVGRRYHNLEAHPEARLYRRGVSATYVARVVHGPERDRLFGLAERLYRGYGVYAQRTAGVRAVPVLRLTPPAA